MIAKQINRGVGFIDVGTDHGYLPVYMAQSGYPGKIFASDINAGPISAAEKAARDAGVFDRISFSLSDGLENCRSDLIDTIVIAGMGGDLICDILDKAEWTMAAGYTMVLQPMTKAEVLRYWLNNNDYRIVNEGLAEDAGTVYQIMTAKYGRDERLSLAELYTGRADIVAEKALFSRQLDALIKRFNKALDGLMRSRFKPAGREEIYREILAELMEIKNNDDKQ